MENTKNRSKVAEGFSFKSSRGAELADAESKKVAYLDSKLDYNKPESIYKIYEKAVSERIFKTPVGILYLKKLQDYLLKCDAIDSSTVSNIPIFESFEDTVRDNASPAKVRVRSSDKKKSKAHPMTISVILNVLLIIALIAMFQISLNAGEANIINYERVITDKYASWEEQLTDKEQEIRDKERELNSREQVIAEKESELNLDD